MFKHVKQNRAFEDVLNQVQEMILQGELKVGDKLPSERHLREMFNVSRGTLREAFRGLEQKGLINIKTGVQGGAIVCPINTKLMSESLDLLLQQRKISLRELAEFREGVEGLVAEKAAQNVKKENLIELKTLLQNIERHTRPGELRWDEFIAQDTQFHLCLARIAGNRIYESVLSTVYENINRYFDRFLPKTLRILRRDYKDLCAIAAAVEQKDLEKAKSLVQRHVRRFNQKMEKKKDPVIEIEGRDRI
jgi:GntR family transcriptional regulator, transcriptional repressor for pyruvate dehydrogenase complex